MATLERDMPVWNALLAISRSIDTLNRWISRIAVWFVLLAALLSAFNAFVRYSITALIAMTSEGRSMPWLQPIVAAYSNNSNSLLEAQWYMFAAIVMLGASYTLKVNEHVRVDLFYGWVSDRTRIWIDLIGAIVCIIPMCIVLIYFTWPWFLQSWAINEHSSSAGGLVVWPAKLILPVGFSLVLLQGISEIIKCLAALSTGYMREHAHYEKPLQ